MPKDLETKLTKSFHQALKPVLVIAQCIGILPVDGICSQDSIELRFRWKSKKVFYTFFVLVSSSGMTLLSGVRMVRLGISFDTSGDVIFYSCSTMVITLFLQLGVKWPRLMSHWRTLEERTHGMSQSYFSFTVYSVLIVVLSLSLVEHFLANLGTILNGVYCSKSYWGVMKYYYTNAFRQVFSFTSYSPWKGILCSYILLVSTLAWNFMDLMIILISLALSNRLRDFNSMMKRLDGKDLYYHVWKLSRESFNRISMLTKTIDRYLSPIVLLSFSSNLYFICFQLLHNLKPVNSTIQEVYFIISFSYLLMRTSAVSLCAAKINASSRDSLQVLFSVTSECYNTEVERLITQMAYDELTITGCKFFTITRRFILTVAGTIFTYEIILLQLNGNNPELNSPQKNITCPPLD